MNLPANATTGTYTLADGAALGYAETFNDSDDSVSLAYFSNPATITVTSAGAVGSVWNGTFSAPMVDITPGGSGSPTTATGIFSILRVVDDL